MDDTQFQTFFAGAMVLLVAAGLLISWLLWRMIDERRDAEVSALDGIGHEMRINLQRMMTEIAQIAVSPELPASALLPISHPQLDGVLTAVVKTDRNALAVIAATYQELTARKTDLRATLAQRKAPNGALDDAMDALIDGIATLYLWEAHAGAKPSQAASTRSWHVRDWMKDRGFAANALPGMHLRDQVVERLRGYGMELTPAPLTHTASEYYAMSYDRYADPDAPFWKRKTKDQDVVEEVIETLEEVASPLSDATEIDVR